MNYCILIEITRDTISFYYNKEDGENRFVAYGDELVKPLAIICEGDELSLGSYARNEAKKGNHNAYINVFDVIQKRAVIKYHGNNYDINKILFLAIEKYISDFFERILLRQNGSLDDNRASLPLVLVFGNDLKENERSFVRESFRKGGYCHVEETDYNRIIWALLHQHPMVDSHPIMYIGRHNANVYCHLVVNGASELEFILNDVGDDPRIEVAAESIWKEIRRQDYYGTGNSKQDDEQKVTDAARRFLLSGLPELEANVCLSDGVSYNYFLQLKNLNRRSQTVDDNCQRAYMDIESQLANENIESASCEIVLVDRDVSNDYMESFFKNKFTNVVMAKDNDWEEARNRILESVKKRGYNIGNNGQKKTVDKDEQLDKAKELLRNGHFEEAKVLFKMVGKKEESSFCSECIRNERELKVANNQTRQQILVRWRKKGISDSVIEKYSSDISGSQPVKFTTKSKEPSPKAKDPMEMEARALFEKGDFKAARDKYRAMGGHGNQIRICTDCIKSEKGLLHADDQTKFKTIAKWRELGINETFIHKYVDTVKDTSQIIEKKSEGSKRTRTENGDRKSFQKESIRHQQSEHPKLTNRELRERIAECKGLLNANRLDEGKRKFKELKDAIGNVGITAMDANLKKKYEELLSLIIKK